MRALSYLQTKLNAIINHEDGKELSEFHKLASLLFKPVDAPGDTSRLMSVVSPLPLPVNITSTSSPDSSSMDDDETSSESVRQLSAKIPRSSTSADELTTEAVEQQIMIKSQRCLLYNRLVELMPDQILCQPKGNLSDLVLI